MTVVPPDSRESSRSCDLVESPIDQTSVDWSRLVPRTENGFYDTQSWHVANADLTGARSSALVSWDPQMPRRVPRAVVPVYRYPDAPPNPAFDPARLFPAGGLDPAAWGPITLLGTTVGYETSPLCRETDQAWWARAAEVVSAGTSGTVACLYLDERDALRLAEHLPEAHLLLSQARTVLPILGQSVTEHLAALTDKQRRKGRKEPERLKLTGRHPSWRPLRPEDVRGYATLQMCTQRKHGSGGTTESFTTQFNRYIENRQLQRSAVIFVIEHDGVPVGYTLAFRHYDALVLRMIGVDYNLAKEGEYFSLLVHEPVRYCVEHGLSKVSFGLAAYRQKLLRGGRLVPLYSLLLDPPSGWTAAHTRRQNASAAQSLIRETEGLLAERELRVLQRLARTGRVETSGAASG
jgi:hypothetical protein